MDTNPSVVGCDIDWVIYDIPEPSSTVTDLNHVRRSNPPRGVFTMSEEFVTSTTSTVQEESDDLDRLLGEYMQQDDLSNCSSESARKKSKAQVKIVDDVDEKMDDLGELNFAILCSIKCLQNNAKELSKGAQLKLTEELFTPIIQKCDKTDDFSSSDEYIRDIKLVLNKYKALSPKKPGSFEERMNCEVHKHLRKLYDHAKEDASFMKRCISCVTNYYTEDFTKICSNPHALIWCKMSKSAPFWPAKALYIDRKTQKLKVKYFGDESSGMVDLTSRLAYYMTRDYSFSQKLSKKQEEDLVIALKQRDVHVKEIKKNFPNQYRIFFDELVVYDGSELYLKEFEDSDDEPDTTDGGDFLSSEEPMTSDEVTDDEKITFSKEDIIPLLKDYEFQPYVYIDVDQNKYRKLLDEFTSNMKKQDDRNESSMCITHKIIKIDIPQPPPLKRISVSSIDYNAKLRDVESKRLNFVNAIEARRADLEAEFNRARDETLVDVINTETKLKEEEIQSVTERHAERMSAMKKRFWCIVCGKVAVQKESPNVDDMFAFCSSDCRSSVSNR
ncbi:hypothetical protein HDE_02518 [Halotydeus destructor]|nr:hypothetical protein HDE_02518 [Halotydeus destructor]